MSANNLPSVDQLEAWNRRLLDDQHLLDDLKVTKGWLPETLKELGIGFDGQWIIIPFHDWENGPANVMKYKPRRATTDTGPKMLPFCSGHGRSLYPLPRSWPESTGAGSTIFLVEGEPDAITARSMSLSARGRPDALEPNSSASRISGKPDSARSSCSWIAAMQAL